MKALSAMWRCSASSAERVDGVVLEHRRAIHQRGQRASGLLRCVGDEAVALGLVVEIGAHADGFPACARASAATARCFAERDSDATSQPCARDRAQRAPKPLAAPVTSAQFITPRTPPPCGEGGGGGEAVRHSGAACRRTPALRNALAPASPRKGAGAQRTRVTSLSVIVTATKPSPESTDGFFTVTSTQSARAESERQWPATRSASVSIRCAGSPRSSRMKWRMRS